MASFNRRTLLRAGGGLATVVAAGGGVAGLTNLARALADDRGAGADELRVGYLPITDAAPLLIAHGDGIYQQQRLTVARPVLFRSWAALAEAFLTRQIDIVHILMPMGIQLRASVGADARLVSWNHTGGGAVTVRPDLVELGEIAGTQFAIPGWWSIHSTLLQRMLRASGLTPVVRRTPRADRGEVELIVMGPSDMIPALANASISGYTVADPFNAAGEVQGIGRIHTFLDEVWEDHACCVNVVHQDLIDRDPDTVQAFTDSIVDAQLRIRDDREIAAEVLSTGGAFGDDGYLPQPLPAITASMAGDIEATGRPRIDFQPYPFPSFSAELVRQMEQTLVDGDTAFLDRISPETIHDEFADVSFVRRSLERAGGPRAFGLPADLTREERILL